MSNSPHPSLAANKFPPALRPFYEVSDRVQVIGERLRMDWLRVHRHLLTPALLDQLQVLESDRHPFREAFDALDRHCVDQVMNSIDMSMLEPVTAYRQTVDGGLAEKPSIEAVMAMMAKAGSVSHADYLRTHVTSLSNPREWANGRPRSPALRVPTPAPVPQPRSFEQWARDQSDLSTLDPLEAARRAYEGGLAEVRADGDHARPADGATQEAVRRERPQG